MTRNLHDEARELIALGEGLPDAQQVWLRAHLNECEACRNYAEAANRVVRSLRSLPLAADSRLVRATQMRVRFHASRLHETRERLWLVGMACLGVGRRRHSNVLSGGNGMADRQAQKWGNKHFRLGCASSSFGDRYRWLDQRPGSAA
jgi:hypothetical protein